MNLISLVYINFLDSSAMCADIIAFVGKLTFTEFLTKTSELNSLPTYSQLLQRAQRVGYDISKVVYTGYHSSEQLQVGYKGHTLICNTYPGKYKYQCGK